MVRFEGNTGINPGQDKRYRVISNGAKWKVGTTFIDGDGVFEILSDGHENLINAILEIKPKGGSFRITEHRNVIVPRNDDGSDSVVYYTVGKYMTPIRFKYGMRIVAGEALDPMGNPLTPGNRWTGSMAGIQYVLAAGGNDIYYKKNIPGGGKIKIWLSHQIGNKAAVKVANTIKKVKGTDGGGFYVNGFQEMFGPVQIGTMWIPHYFGKIDILDWFPDPHPNNPIIK